MTDQMSPAGIPGYFVTSDGVVLSTKRGSTPRIVRPFVNDGGYLRVQLWNNSIRRHLFVHKLVASAFCGQCPSSEYECRHIDGNRQNNRASNLCWVVRKEPATNTTKKCRECLTVKDLSEFHPHKECADGHDTTCKLCIREYQNQPHVRQQHREYRHSEHGRAVRKANVARNAQSPAQRERERRHAAKYRAQYPGKAKAKLAVRTALEAGLIVRPTSCPQCGRENPKIRNGRTAIHAHHHNGYDDPLDIKWLCLWCHAKEHGQVALKRESG